MLVGIVSIVQLTAEQRQGGLPSTAEEDRPSTWLNAHLVGIIYELALLGGSSSLPPSLPPSLSLSPKAEP